jgi:flagellar biosynthesis protein FliQ
MAGNETDLFVGVAQQAVWVTALVAAPLLLAALAVGLLVGIVQAATSINEQTLSFVPKLLVCALVLALLGGAMLTLIGDFTRDLFSMVGDITA